MKSAGLHFFPILVLLFVPISQAQQFEPETQILQEYVEKNSWEPDDLDKEEALYDKPKGLNSPVGSVTLSLIRVYQKRISPKSTMNRCPFKTSCSNFAFQSISRQGFLVGMLLFIDRYYYRENISAPYNYPLYENEEGVLKLNDDYYLKGAEY